MVVDLWWCLPLCTSGFLRNETRGLRVHRYMCMVKLGGGEHLFLHTFFGINCARKSLEHPINRRKCQRKDGARPLDQPAGSLLKFPLRFVCLKWPWNLDCLPKRYQSTTAVLPTGATCRWAILHSPGGATVPNISFYYLSAGPWDYLTCRLLLPQNWCGVLCCYLDCRAS